MQNRYLVNPDFHYKSRMNYPFCEENAHDLLTRYFSNIEKDVYDDTLHIDNSDIVIGYLRSILPSIESPPDEGFYREYAQYVEREITKNGWFRVEKRTVFYTCQ